MREVCLRERLCIMGEAGVFKGTLMCYGGGMFKGTLMCYGGGMFKGTLMYYGGGRFV